MIITPSILEKKPEDITTQILKLVPYYPIFQIDFADGIDVPNTTLKPEEFEQVIKKLDKSILNKIQFEFHLMVKDFESTIKIISAFKNKINIRDILIHASYLPNISILNTKYQIPFGLVLYPEDPISLITNHYTPDAQSINQGSGSRTSYIKSERRDLNPIPYIQIMSCTVGFQGSPFLPESLNKIEQLRNANYKNIISLDGAINDKTLPIIITQQFKPDIVCPGSFLCKAKDLKKNVEFLQNIKHLRKEQAN
ncbi:MAG: hypothetical protein Q7R95_06835 [bacterium]|nr:hypothetical protein [bacterium]